MIHSMKMYLAYKLALNQIMPSWATVEDEWDKFVVDNRNRKELLYELQRKNYDFFDKTNKKHPTKTWL